MTIPAPERPLPVIDPRINPTLSIPDAGRIVAGLSRGASYKAAREGRIVTVDIGGRRKRVSCAWVRVQLGLEPWPADPPARTGAFASSA